MNGLSDRLDAAVKARDKTQLTARIASVEFGLANIKREFPQGVKKILKKALANIVEDM